MPILDIIVPHYNEPWSECGKLFEMIALQRGVDFESFRVLLVNDGEGNEIIENVYRRKYPFEVVGLTIPHGGVSAARNRGLEFSRAEWVMFCDCDDCFTSIYSMSCIMQVLDTDKYDLLWSPFYVETNEKGVTYVRDEFNQIFIHCKVFRRKFLMDHGMRFNTDLTYSEDTAFCSVLGMEIEPERIGKIETPIIPYVWTFRVGSATTHPDKRVENSIGLFTRQMYVIEEYAKRGRKKEANELAYRAMCDAYVLLNRHDWDVGEDFKKTVQEFCRKYYDCEMWVDHETADRAINGAIREAYGLNDDLPPRSGFYKWYTEFRNGLIRG